MAKVSTPNAIGEKKEKGNVLVGDKTINYMVEKSRVSVEDYNNYEVILYQTDWLKSKKNAYGEIKQIRFKNATGIKLNVKLNVKQNPAEKKNNIINKTNVVTISLYDELLKDRGVDINKGDYFVYGVRVYYIYDYTIKDTEGVGMANGEKVVSDFFAYEETDERILNDINNNIAFMLNTK